MLEVASRVEKHRASLRKSGLRPIQIWVPDTRMASFAKECKRQSALLKNDAQEKKMLHFIDKAASRDGWTS